MSVLFLLLIHVNFIYFSIFFFFFFQAEDGIRDFCLSRGLGQVFGEQVVYDRQTGQLLTGSFMDYVMPRSEILKRVELHDHSVPSPSNPLGVKGAGEAGTTLSLIHISEPT